MISIFFIVSTFYNMDIVLYIGRNMYNMSSVLELLDVTYSFIFAKTACENERSCSCMSYVFIFDLYMYSHEGENRGSNH